MFKKKSKKDFFFKKRVKKNVFKLGNNNSHGRAMKNNFYEICG